MTFAKLIILSLVCAEISSAANSARLVEKDKHDGKDGAFDEEPAYKNNGKDGAFDEEPAYKNICGQILIASSGEIKHPSTGDSYENYEDCIWRIESPGPINITFVSFDIEEDTDILEIRDGPRHSAPLLGEFTGSSLPQPIETTDGWAYLHFSSDASDTKSGFVLHFGPADSDIDGKDGAFDEEPAYKNRRGCRACRRRCRWGCWRKCYWACRRW